MPRSTSICSKRKNPLIIYLFPSWQPRSVRRGRVSPAVATPLHGPRAGPRLCGRFKVQTEVGTNTRWRGDKFVPPIQKKQKFYYLKYIGMRIGKRRGVVRRNSPLDWASQDAFAGCASGTGRILLVSRARSHPPAAPRGIWSSDTSNIGVYR